ncbi:hypothetical protein KTC96_23275 (plasmid) [Clostridium estertheticum]|uniref:hypothetical protein n=1 Tax=Clostridium estertheticum TaxID=238834 RepID=UPI001C7D5C42|nr:hypothetical protein [Clostridium estertheticum]MBX4262783.1 hypothetical protein [Clostridium estertheticum]WLC72817.1 hypothetical protein KTC96_23275 [Clostridium estertheticum]
MKATFQAISMDVRRAFCSFGFLLAILGVCMVYYAGAMTFFSYADILFMFKYATEGSSFNHVLLLFCALPYTTSFCNDWNSKYIRSIIARMGTKRYAASKIISCALSSGTAMVLGILLFIFPLLLRIPLVATNARLANYKQFVATLGGSFLLNGHFIMYFIIYIYLAFLAAAFWSVLGLCVSAYIPNKFVALFTPFIGLYVLAYITCYFPIWLQVNKITTGNFIINGTFISLIYATLFVTVLISCFGLLFHKAIKRRISNE